MKSRTAKHKTRRFLGKVYGDTTSDKQPGLTLRRPVSIPINSSTFDLPESYFDSAIHDIQGDDTYFDAREDSDSELDKFEVNMEDFTFTSDGDVFLLSTQGSDDIHGLSVYQNITGNKFNIFVSDSEDDGSVF